MEHLTSIQEKTTTYAGYLYAIKNRTKGFQRILSSGNL